MKHTIFSHVKMISLVAVAVSALSACSSIDKATTSDQSLKEKAAFALGVSPATVSVSDLHSNRTKISFHASTQGKMYSCYYTRGFGLAGESDAICASTDGSGKQMAGECNALTKAAGMCN